jgi:hypothetical protein
MRAKKVRRITFRTSEPFLLELRKAAKQDQRTLSDWIQIKLAGIIAERQSKEAAA